MTIGAPPCSGCGHPANLTLCEPCAAGLSTTIELSRAVLCVECEAVYRLPAITCPRCGSASGLNLGRLLQAEKAAA